MTSGTRMPSTVRSTTGSGASTCRGRGSLGFKAASRDASSSLSSDGREGQSAARSRSAGDTIVVIRLAELNAGLLLRQLRLPSRCEKAARARQRQEDASDKQQKQ